MAGHWGLRLDSRDKRGFTAEELMRGRGDANPELQRAFASLLRACMELRQRSRRRG